MLEVEIKEIVIEYAADQCAEHRRVDWALEGGAIESDGAGTLLTTWRCLHQRHPQLSRDQITHILQTQGIQVTRRTVAKYREDMHIPSTHQRRVKN